MGLKQASGSARVFNYEARSAMALPFLFKMLSIILSSREFY